MRVLSHPLTHSCLPTLAFPYTGALNCTGPKASPTIDDQQGPSYATYVTGAMGTLWLVVSSLFSLRPESISSWSITAVISLCMAPKNHLPASNRQSCIVSPVHSPEHTNEKAESCKGPEEFLRVLNDGGRRSCGLLGSTQHIFNEYQKMSKSNPRSLLVQGFAQNAFLITATDTGCRRESTTLQILHISAKR
ncbi:LRRGT00190 [Rattus norvegicus]|uniref:LRRGT00190 n=2 Tax=Rattus norvegicus TaxID=10116 RepID=A6KKH4_RAT|nr:LRRGT00190 [Rattus norvegicus]EDL88536.1 LRRGT00190 [Rattus norvegicus]|eukprot:NP_001041393.1 uncharacterized protein LOC498339 [Rattus norvegicus]